MSSTRSIEELRQRILELVRRAETSLPREELPELPPGQLTKGEPEWHRFEREIWDFGESIRQLINGKPSLRGDPELLRAFLRIARDGRARRGRQSFILLFAYKLCAPFASELIEQIDDVHVCGHVIDALLKMGIAGFVARIKPFTSHEQTWIKNTARKYCERYNA
jgi:hypothetical protein